MTAAKVGGGGLVLLAYVNRSGSTLLSQQMSRSPDVCVCPEANIPLRWLVEGTDAGARPRPELVRRIQEALRTDAKLSSWELTAGDVRLDDAATAFEALRRIVTAYRDRTKPGARWILCKGPFFLEAHEGLSQAGRSAGVDVRLVAMIRDGRAVYASQKRSLSTNTGQPMQVDPIRAARTWSAFVRGALAREQRPDVSVVRYERLVERPEDVVRELVASLGIDEDALEDRGDLWSRIPEAQRALHTRIAGPPDPERIEAWRRHLGRDEIALFEAAAGAEMDALGYVRTDRVLGPARRVLLTFAYRIKWLANRARGRLFRLMSRRPVPPD